MYFIYIYNDAAAAAATSVCAPVLAIATMARCTNSLSPRRIPFFALLQCAKPVRNISYLISDLYVRVCDYAMIWPNTHTGNGRVRTPCNVQIVCNIVCSWIKNYMNDCLPVCKCIFHKQIYVSCEQI